MMAFLHKLVFEDFWLKLFSLVLAVMMWVTISATIRQGNPSASPLGTSPLVTGSKVTRTFPRVPVLVLTSTPQTAAFKIQPESVELTVEGDATVVNDLQNSELSVVADLVGIRAAQALTMKLKVSKPPGVATVKVVPDEVQVTSPAKN